MTVDRVSESDKSETGYLLVGSQRQWIGSDKGSPGACFDYTIDDDSGHHLGHMATFPTDDPLLLERMPAGSYKMFVCAIGWVTNFFPGESPEFRFTIYPGQITYLGDFHLTAKIPSSIFDAREKTLQVFDNQDSVVKLFEKEFPVISKSYPIRSEVKPTGIFTAF